MPSPESQRFFAVEKPPEESPLPSGPSPEGAPVDPLSRLERLSAEELDTEAGVRALEDLVRELEDRYRPKERAPARREEASAIGHTLERLLADPAVNKGQVAQSLAGVGGPEALALRERLLTDPQVDKDYVALGLAGVGGAEALALRERLLTDPKVKVNKDYVAWGLAGVGGPEALALREPSARISRIR